MNHCVNYMVNIFDPRQLSCQKKSMRINYIYRDMCVFWTECKWSPIVSLVYSLKILLRNHREKFAIACWHLVIRTRSIRFRLSLKLSLIRRRSLLGPEKLNRDTKKCFWTLVACFPRKRNWSPVCSGTFMYRCNVNHETMQTIANYYGIEIDVLEIDHRLFKNY